MKNRRILIIDDDLELSGVLKTILESRGYETRHAPDSEEGLALARRRKPDLILLDMMMRTVSEGVSAAQKIKSDPELKSIPVIMMTAVEKETGFSFSPDSDHEFLPVERLLNKPVDPRTLLEEIEAVLGG